MKKTFILIALFASAVSAMAQLKATVTIDANSEGEIIPKEIYGQFAEHLGSCIYGGLWVGEDSSIRNINGYRADVFEALKDLKVPVLRWPGGCFADEYHWTDGIGPRSERPTMANNNWGGTIEDNSFGTHEFLNLCEMLGCEPYISGNVGSGTVEELAKWVEYMTSEGDSPMARLRRQNGREKAWKIKYLGVGNESWGCGGNMRPEFYADLYRRYQTYCRNYDGNELYKVASGASDYDLNWTRVLMDRARGHMAGLSLHYYSVINGWDVKGSATIFDDSEYYRTLAKCRGIEKVLQDHIAIMDEYDPKHRVDLLLDEWGTWWDVEPGTNPGHLFQQNTMRDAMVASLSFDIFHKYTKRLKMCNIAQIVNVLQSMILTKDDKMVLTPTYYVFKMYNVHQDARLIPLTIDCKKFESASTDDRYCNVVPMLSATCSRDNAGKVHLSLSNVSLTDDQTVTVNLGEIKVDKVKGEILTSPKIDDYNSFDNPNKVKAEEFKAFKKKGNTLEIKMPKNSIVTLSLLSPALSPDRGKGVNTL